MRTVSLVLILTAILAAFSSATEAPPGNAEDSRLDRKLDSIVIPKIDFRDVTVTDAIAFLRQQSKLLDKSGKSPEDNGVNFVLKLNEEQRSQLVSLELDKVPLRAAIRYVCTLGNLKFKVEPEAILIVHVQDAAF